jgi:hypothetical protein
MPSITPIYLPYYVLIDCCIPTCICTHTKLSKTSIFLGQILNPKTSFFGTKGVSWMLSWDDGGVCGGWGGWVSGCVWGGGQHSVTGGYTRAYLARPGTGPPTDLTGQVWTEILKPTNFFLA